MNYVDPELRNKLAAEYAIGTMHGLTRRRFERLLSGDAGLRDLVQDWELRVNLLAERAPAVEPPPHIWEEISRRTEPAPVHASVVSWLWESLGFWRGAAALTSAAAAALALYIALQPPAVEPQQLEALSRQLERIEGSTRSLAGTPNEIAALGDRVAGLSSRLNAVAPVPSHVAVLLDKDRRPMMTADLDAADGRLVLRLNIKPPRDFTAKVLEVWLLAPGGMPRSLGLFPSEKSGTTAALTLSHDVAEALASGALAVSLEPSGGSATGQPSGPVLFSGEVIPVDL